MDVTEEYIESIVRTLKKKINSKLDRHGFNTQILAGNLTLVVASPKLQFLDANGVNRTITLPAEASSEELVFYFFNLETVAGDLIIEDDAAATIITVSPNESGMVACNGTIWRGMIGGIT